MNYKIIKDRDILLHFIEWLPNLEKNERYYLSLFARKKYDPSVVYSSDRTQLERIASKKENILYNIEKLEIPLNKYRLKDKVVTEKSLVLYINPNPRCLKKATKFLGEKCWKLVENDNYCIHHESMTAIQNSKSRSIYTHFDIDGEEDISKVSNILKTKDYKVLRTRGGHHLLVNSKEESNLRKLKGLFCKTWEGTLQTGETSGTSMNFTVQNPNLIDSLKNYMGKEITVKYTQCLFNTPCSGNSDYLIESFK